MIEINIFNQSQFEIDEVAIDTLVRRIWKHEVPGAAHLNLIFVTPEHIRRLNRQFLNKEYTTDVIAFPLSALDDEIYEGEIYICLDQVFENAVSYHIEKEQELKRVVAHGILHLLGYDDKNARDKLAMTERENYYLKGEVT